MLCLNPFLQGYYLPYVTFGIGLWRNMTPLMLGVGGLKTTGSSVLWLYTCLKMVGYIWVDSKPLGFSECIMPFGVGYEYQLMEFEMVEQNPFHLHYQNSPLPPFIFHGIACNRQIEYPLVLHFNFPTFSATFSMSFSPISIDNLCYKHAINNDKVMRLTYFCQPNWPQSYEEPLSDSDGNDGGKVSKKNIATFPKKRGSDTSGTAQRWERCSSLLKYRMNNDGLYSTWVLKDPHHGAVRRSGRNFWPSFLTHFY